MYLVLYFVVYVTLIVYKTKMPIQGPERVGVWILLVLAVIIGLWALIYAYTNTGNDGVKGVSGENGDQGLPGDQGLQGNQGLQGDTGPVASFTALPFTADNSVNLNVTAIQTGQLVIIEGYGALTTAAVAAGESLQVGSLVNALIPLDNSRLLVSGTGTHTGPSGIGAEEYAIPVLFDHTDDKVVITNPPGSGNTWNITDLIMFSITVQVAAPP